MLFSSSFEGFRFCGGGFFAKIYFLIVVYGLYSNLVSASQGEQSVSYDDPWDKLYRPSLVLDHNAEPSVGILLMSGQSRIGVRAIGGGLILRPRSVNGDNERIVSVPSGSTVFLSYTAHRPGTIFRYPVVAEHSAGTLDEEALLSSIDLWMSRGYEIRVENLGSVFGFGGRVVDNRRVLVMIDGPGDSGWAASAAEAVSAFLEQTPVLHEIRTERATATVLISDPSGSVLARAQNHVQIESEGSAWIEVLEVEHGVGYTWHGRENRTYDGEIYVVADDKGLSAVNLIAVETLLRGIVPAETYASAHLEALKAQAVTARTDILAKVGTRHLGDPALICAETHCQVYKGRDAAASSTDLAITQTRGEVLVRQDGRLVNAVYSAMCGGHTESNEVVWGTPPDSALRGRLDFPAEGKWLRYAAGIGEEDLPAWLSESPPSWCGMASVGSSSRFRWTRRMSAEEMNRRVAHLGLGSVERIEILGRGVSGRIRAVRIVGNRKSTIVRRELPVRRLFGNLDSGMFIVETELNEDGKIQVFIFRGGGWGHGVGMCQTGAIGMAEHGHDYRSILRHYYNGADIASIY